MPRCLKCQSDASLCQGTKTNEKYFCVIHFNLDGDSDVVKYPVKVIDEEIMAEQVLQFQKIARNAITDVAMKMYEVQKKEENENRLRTSKVPVGKSSGHVVPSGIVDNRNKVSRGSLWSTNISQLDKSKILNEIERSEQEENTLKTAENTLGVACISCGSRSTVARNRYALETCKNEVWGNKDNDSGLVTIECLGCGYIGSNV